MNNASAQAQKIKQKDLKNVVARMCGEFSSEEQSIADTSFFNILLRMRRIWPEKKDGYWLYVEQSVATSQQTPYRQRIYHVFKSDDTTIISKVYEMFRPLKYAGAWNDPTKISILTTDSLIDR